mgnify:CR=1 FL=1
MKVQSYISILQNNMSIQSDLKVIKRVRSNPLNTKKDKQRLINDTLKMVNNYLRFILSDINIMQKKLKRKTRDI